MDNIASELGMSKKTLYDHFNSKADLLAKALQMALSEFSNWYDEMKKLDLNAIDELLEISRRVNEEYDRFTPSNIFDLKKYYPDVINEHFEKEKKLTYKVLIENLDKGIAQGFYRSNLDIELIAMLYLQKIEALHTDGFWEDADVRFEKVFEIMFESHIRGIVNQSGLAYFETCKSHLNFEKYYEKFAEHRFFTLCCRFISPGSTKRRTR